MWAHVLKLLFLTGFVSFVDAWWGDASVPSASTSTETQANVLDYDLSGLAGDAAGVERALRGERVRSSKLLGDNEELHRQLLSTARYKSMLHSRDQMMTRASKALSREYARKYHTVLSTYAKGAKSLKKGLHQCVGGRAEMKKTLAETEGYLASERNWRDSAEVTLGNLQREDSHLRELVANVTASELRDHQREWGLERALAEQTKKRQSSQQEAKNLSRQQEDSVREEAGTQLKFSGEARTNEQLDSELKFEVTTESMKATEFHKREMTWAHEADIFDGELEVEGVKFAAAHRNTSVAMHNVLVAQSMRSKLVTERDQARRALAVGSERSKDIRQQVATAQQLLDETRRRGAEQGRDIRHEYQESDAQAGLAGQVVKVNAQLAATHEKIARLENEHMAEVAEMNVWKQRAEELNASLVAMQRLEQEVGITRGELADRERQLEETNSTKAQLAMVTVEAEREAKRLAEEKARLSSAAVNAHDLQKAKAAERDESKQLGAIKQKLSIAVEESQSLTKIWKVLELELDTATVEKKKATAAQAALDAEKAKAHVLSLKLQGLELEAAKAQSSGNQATLARLLRQASQRHADLEVSHKNKEALVKDQAVAKAELAAMRAHLNASQASVGRNPGNSSNSTTAALRAKDAQIAKDLAIVQSAEAALSKDLAGRKAALVNILDEQAQAVNNATRELPKDWKASRKQLNATRAETTEEAKKARTLGQQASEARDLIAKDANLIARCLNHTKSIKKELEDNFESERLVFEKEIGSKYKALAKELQSTRHEQIGLLDQNKALVAMVDKMRLKLLDVKKS